MEARAPLNAAPTPTLDKHCNREWLDAADEGVILVSFGSVSDHETDSCPKEKSVLYKIGVPATLNLYQFKPLK